jgi:hypothetical protein
MSILKLFDLCTNNLFYSQKNKTDKLFIDFIKEVNDFKIIKIILQIFKI